MKKRIGNLRGKPIIEGDINLKTNNEIHKSELYKTHSEEGTSNNQYSYYKILNPDFWNLGGGSVEMIIIVYNIDQILYSWDDFVLRSNFTRAMLDGTIDTAVAFRYPNFLPTTEDAGYYNNDQIEINTYEFKGTFEERLAEAVKMSIEETTSMLYTMIAPITEEEYTSMIKNK